MKLLLIEDEAKTVSFLKKGFSEVGYVVDVAMDGEDGLHLASNGDYDVIVLDVMLPGCDGWSVIRDLRQAGKDTPAVFLTARDAVSDRVKGLQLGGDDYLVKPFAFSELLARIQTILRRSSVRQSDQLQVADLKIDVLSRKVARAGRRIDLTPKEFLLLSLFARRAGDVLGRILIAEQVWDINFDSDTNVVDVHVRRLRSKIDDPFDKKLLHTVRGAGYVLEDRG